MQKSAHIPEQPRSTNSFQNRGDGLRPGGRTRHGNNLRQFKKMEHAVVGQTKGGTVPSSSTRVDQITIQITEVPSQPNKKRKAQLNYGVVINTKSAQRNIFSQGLIFHPPYKLSKPTIPTHDLQDQESITEKNKEKRENPNNSQLEITQNANQHPLCKLQPHHVCQYQSQPNQRIESHFIPFECFSQQKQE